MVTKYHFLSPVGDRPHANDQDREAGLPSKKTALSEKSAEKLMEAIQTYKQYKTECAESLKGNFFWLINNILKSSLIFYQVIVRKERNNDFSIFHHIFSYFRVGEFLDNNFLFNLYHIFDNFFLISVFKNYKIYTFQNLAPLQLCP